MSDIEIVGSINPIRRYQPERRVFAFVQVPYHVLNKCQAIISQLQESYNTDKIYTRDISHVVVDRTTRNTVILGALASGKYIVSPSYILESGRKGRFVDEENHVPSALVEDIARVKRHGKVFGNQHVVLLIRDPRKRVELSAILQDGGAMLLPWTSKDLLTETPLRRANLDVIFTEPDFLNDPLFSGFMKLRLQKKLRVKVLSFFSIYKIILSVPGSEERQRINQIFDIESNFIASLHAQVAKRKPFERSETRRKKLRLNSAKDENTITIDLDGQEAEVVDFVAPNSDVKQEIVSIENDVEDEVEVIHIRTLKINRHRTLRTIAAPQNQILDSPSPVTRPSKTSEQCSIESVNIQSSGNDAVISSPNDVTFLTNSSRIFSRNNTIDSQRESIVESHVNRTVAQNSYVEITLDDSDVDDEVMIVDETPSVTSKQKENVTAGCSPKQIPFTIRVKEEFKSPERAMTFNSSDAQNVEISIINVQNIDQQNRQIAPFGQIGCQVLPTGSDILHTLPFVGPVSPSIFQPSHTWPFVQHYQQMPPFLLQGQHSLAMSLTSQHNLQENDQRKMEESPRNMSESSSNVMESPRNLGESTQNLDEYVQNFAKPQTVGQKIAAQLPHPRDKYSPPAASSSKVSAESPSRNSPPDYRSRHSSFSTDRRSQHNSSSFVPIGNIIQIIPSQSDEINQNDESHFKESGNKLVESRQSTTTLQSKNIQDDAISHSKLALQLSTKDSRQSAATSATKFGVAQNLVLSNNVSGQVSAASLSTSPGIQIEIGMRDAESENAVDLQVANTDPCKLRSNGNVATDDNDSPFDGGDSHRIDVALSSSKNTAVEIPAGVRDRDSSSRSVVQRDLDRLLRNIQEKNIRVPSSQPQKSQLDSRKNIVMPTSFIEPTAEISQQIFKEISELSEKKSCSKTSFQTSTSTPSQATSHHKLASSKAATRSKLTSPSALATSPQKLISLQEVSLRPASLKKVTNRSSPEKKSPEKIINSITISTQVTEIEVPKEFDEEVTLPVDKSKTSKQENVGPNIFFNKAKKPHLKSKNGHMSSTKLDKENIDKNIKSQTENGLQNAIKLDLNLLDKHLTVFLDRQRSGDICIDIGNALARTPKFDSTKQSGLTSNFLESGCQYPASVTRDLPKHFEVFFDRCTKYNSTEHEVFGLQLIQDFSELVNSRFYPKAITVNKTLKTLFLDHKFTDSLEQDLVLRKTAIISTMAKYFFMLFFLHSPRSDMKRLFYLKIFKNVVENSENNFWSFLKDVLDKIKPERAYCEYLALLRVLVLLLRSDLEFWWKHLKEEQKPLISYLFQNQQSLEPILTYILSRLVLSLRHCQFDFQTLLRKLVSMIAMYCSVLDKRCDLAPLELASTGSSKSLCAYLVLNSFALEICDKPKQICAQIFLLRPTWLAAQVSGLFISQMVNMKETCPNFALESFLKGQLFNYNFVNVDQLPAYVPGDSELHRVARYGRTDKIVELLIDNSLMLTTNTEDRTPVHEAARFNRVKCLKVMSDFDAKTFSQALTQKDAFGLTPMALAIKNDASIVANFLLVTLRISDLTPAHSMGLDEPNVDVEFESPSEKMTKVLQRHDCTVKISTADHLAVSGECNTSLQRQVNSQSTVLVREPVLFQLMTSLCFSKLLQVIPANVVCINSLTHQDNAFTGLRFSGLSMYNKIEKKMPHSSSFIKLDNNIIVTKKLFYKDVTFCYDMVMKQREKKEEKNNLLKLVRQNFFCT